MLKLSFLVCAVALLFPSEGPQNGKFSKYKPVEAYEIRPGILMMPKYAENGEVCAITLETTNAFADRINLTPTLPRNTVIELVDELAPVDERGPRTMDFGRDYISQHSGESVTTFAEWENVAVNIYGKASTRCGAGDIVAEIRWKKRTCADAKPAANTSKK
ncbi:MAG TPA: hypothetical protein VI685_20605 [Candidatus Angelobacter sp.]